MNTKIFLSLSLLLLAPVRVCPAEVARTLAARVYLLGALNNQFTKKIRMNNAAMLEPFIDCLNQEDQNKFAEFKMQLAQSQKKLAKNLLGLITTGNCSPELSMMCLAEIKAEKLTSFFTREEKIALIEAEKNLKHYKFQQIIYSSWDTPYNERLMHKDTMVSYSRRLPSDQKPHEADQVAESDGFYDYHQKWHRNVEDLTDTFARESDQSGV